VIRAMTELDVTEVASLHLETFPAFFLSFLGRRFLKLLYQSIVRDPMGIAFVSTGDDDRLLGFVAGVTQQAGFYSRLARKRMIGFAFASAGAALRRPSIIPRLWRALKRSDEARGSTADGSLMSIGVSPAAQSRGIGRDLVATFAAEVRRRGIDRFCLTTDQAGNEAANAFYVSIGFTVARTFVTPEGRVMNEYLMRLD
jgi:ribosomal protein S18 acetylase RimI-like enzyme